MNNIYTPLRYPGGKARLSSYFKSLLIENSLLDSHYVEPFAGGAGIALSLLMTDYCSHIHLNDISFPVYCFWKTVLSNHEYLCKHIKDTDVTPSSWDKQKAVLKKPKAHSESEIGYAFFFLNRTNRSGIQNAGMIGGRKQLGDWQIDARFNKIELIRRIECIAEYKNRISIYNLDAADFIKSTISKLPEKALIYFDPPYYVKGRRLYADYYAHGDHASISNNVQSSLKQPWIVTYDNHPSIIDLYCNRRRFIYNLGYSAHAHRIGTEVMFFSDQIIIPEPDFVVVDKVLKSIKRRHSSSAPALKGKKRGLQLQNI